MERPTQASSHLQEGAMSKLVRASAACAHSTRAKIPTQLRLAQLAFVVTRCGVDLIQRMKSFASVCRRPLERSSWPRFCVAWHRPDRCRHQSGAETYTFSARPNTRIAPTPAMPRNSPMAFIRRAISGRRRAPWVGKGAVPLQSRLISAKSNQSAACPLTRLRVWRVSPGRPALPCW